MRYEQKKVVVTLAAGQTINSERLNLPKGTCVGMCAKPIGNHTDFINLSVLDNGSEVVEASDISFFEKTNAGRWLDSIRPMSFDCGRVADVQLATATALAATYKAQILFIIIQD